MRISDWSSDVCSSDLIILRLHHRKRRASQCLCPVPVAGELVGEHRARADVKHLAGLSDIVERGDRFLDRGLIVEAVDLIEVDIVHPQDRKSVVEGKSGSERLDLGGRRILKKQKQPDHGKVKTNSTTT